MEGSAYVYAKTFLVAGKLEAITRYWAVYALYSGITAYRRQNISADLFFPCDGWR